jgi:hypothetical protein
MNAAFGEIAAAACATRGHLRAGRNWSRCESADAAGRFGEAFDHAGGFAMG